MKPSSIFLLISLAEGSLISLLTMVAFVEKVNNVAPTPPTANDTPTTANYIEMVEDRDELIKANNDTLLKLQKDLKNQVGIRNTSITNLTNLISQTLYAENYEISAKTSALKNLQASLDNLNSTLESTAESTVSDIGHYNQTISIITQQISLSLNEINSLQVLLNTSLSDIALQKENQILILNSAFEDRMFKRDSLYNISLAQYNQAVADLSQIQADKLNSENSLNDTIDSLVAICTNATSDLIDLKNKIDLKTKMIMELESSGVLPNSNTTTNTSSSITLNIPTAIPVNTTTTTTTKKGGAGAPITSIVTGVISSLLG